jgi:hypothetical protein
MVKLWRVLRNSWRRLGSYSNTTLSKVYLLFVLGAMVYNARTGDAEELVRGLGRNGMEV